MAADAPSPVDIYKIFETSEPPPEIYSTDNSRETIWKEVYERIREIARELPQDGDEVPRVRVMKTFLITPQTNDKARSVQLFFFKILLMGPGMLTGFASAVPIKRLGRMTSSHAVGILQLLQSKMGISELKSKGLRDRSKQLGVDELYGKQSGSFQ